MNAFRPVYDPKRQVVPVLQKAWTQSGVSFGRGDDSWLFDQHSENDTIPRMQQILLYADKANGGGMKKFGARLLSTHEFRGAHRAYNFEGAEQFGIKPILLAFAFASHDIVENKRDKAPGLFTPRDEAIITAEITRILDDPFAFKAIRQNNIYMTDPPGSATGAARIQAQIDKTFDSNGRCIVGPMEQIIRAVDKWEQVTADMWARQNGYLPDNQLEAQIMKARQKSRFLQAPAVAPNKKFVKEYTDAQAYLEKEWRAIQDRALTPALAPRLATPNPLDGLYDTATAMFRHSADAGRIMLRVATRQGLAWGRTLRRMAAL